MFTGWVTTMFTLQLNVYTVAISSVNNIVINEWLRLNNSGFLMNGRGRQRQRARKTTLVRTATARTMATTARTTGEDGEDNR